MNDLEPNTDPAQAEHDETELPTIEELEYPKHDLATASRVLGVLSNPKVAEIYNECVIHVNDEEKFQQTFADLRQVCNVARDEVDERLHTLAPVGLAFCYASAYQETGHSHERDSELKALLPTFAPFDRNEQRLHDYTKQALGIYE